MLVLLVYPLVGGWMCDPEIPLGHNDGGERDTGSPQADASPDGGTHTDAGGRDSGRERP